MPNNRAFIFFVLLLLLPISACGREQQLPKTDTAASIPNPVPVPAVVALNPGWDRDKGGPALVTAFSDNGAGVSLVLPFLTDSALAHDSLQASIDSISGMSFDFFDRSGSSGSGRLVSQPVPSAEGCITWPGMRVEGMPRPWRIGLRRGTVTPVPLDSLERMTPADSLRVTTELARLASALLESNDPAFQGLPFSVRKAYRSVRDSILIGDIVRKINEEANPREEHLLLIAEPSHSGDRSYMTGFSTRSAGSEDVVRTTDVLALVRFVDGGNPALFASFEYADGARIVLIEKVNGRWKLSWRSAYAGC